MTENYCRTIYRKILLNLIQRHVQDTMPTAPSQYRLTAASLIMVSLCFLIVWSNTEAEEKAPLVIVDIAEQVPVIEELALSGSVVAPHIAELASEVGGIVASLAVEIGAHVKKDAALLRLDTELHKLALEATRAASEQARQQLDDAKRRLKNAEALVKQQTISENELQSLAAEVRIDGAFLDGVIAEQKRQEALLRRYTLNAPFSGVISRRLVEVGEWVQTGEPLLVIVATDELRLDFQVPQAIFAKLVQTESIDVTLDALPQQVFKGTIETVTPIVDPNSRAFPLRVALNDKQANIAPGMSASAVLRLHSGRREVVVPRDALLRYPDGRITVWVLNENASTVTEHQVKTGLNFDGKVSIVQGLNAGAWVVVQGNEALRTGQTVTVKLPE